MKFLHTHNDYIELKEYRKKNSIYSLINFLSMLLISMLLLTTFLISYLYTYNQITSSPVFISGFLLAFFTFVAVKSQKKADLFSFQELYFEVGDIVVKKEGEAWEKDSFKVLEIGKENYLIQNMKDNKNISLNFKDQIKFMNTDTLKLVN